MGSDDTTTLSFLRGEVKKFIAEREWEKYHTPKNVAESIVIEASELLEIFQWMSNEDSMGYGLKNRDRIGEELADVLIYCLSMANVLDIDVSSAILNKLARDREKYPVEKFKGVYFKQ